MTMNTLQLDVDTMTPAAVIQNDNPSERVVRLTGNQNIVADLLAATDLRFSLIKPKARRLQLVQ